MIQHLPALTFDHMGGAAKLDVKNVISQRPASMAVGYRVLGFRFWDVGLKVG